MRILLVEDDQHVATAIRRVLAKRNLEVVHVPDGLAAMRRLDSEEVFDVILSDAEMPRLDGLGLLHWIQSNRPALASRCAFMTGNDPRVF
jgi:two-component system chemotaxis sensor kinase CheA